MFNIRQAVIKDLPCHVFWKDKRSRFLGCNALFARTAGVNSECDILNKTDFDMPWAKTTAEKYRQDDSKIIQGFQKLNYVESQLQLDGTSKQIITSKTPLLNEKKEIVGILGLFHIISPEHPFFNSQINSVQKKLLFCENEYLQCFTLLQDISEKPKLTRRELECLSVWLYGFSIQETADLFKVSNRTIIGFRTSIKFKLQVERKSQLIEFLFDKELFLIFLHFAKITIKKYSRC